MVFHHIKQCFEFPFQDAFPKIAEPVPVIGDEEGQNVDLLLMNFISFSNSIQPGSSC